jgi:hypothetical protein
MTLTGYKRLVIALSVALLLVLALAGKLFWDAGMLSVQVAFASEQTKIFEDMRTQALSADATGAAQNLEYAVHYYPSGTKQVAGSRLDGVVERARADAVRAIIAHLRTKTGADLGDDPEKWIQKYARP